ncbi:serine hydrolase [Bradyrhizobium sp. 143]|nr:serine hydrolase [Bradyrhizobium sp. 143]MCK1726842.1 serine hydrolase [Bradyrhizobium sp. 142]
MTKTVNAALAGMTIKDGKLSLDKKNPFSQWAGDARAEISVADLMAMTSGLEWNEDHGNSPDLDHWRVLHGMRRRPPACRPAARGEGFNLPADTFMLQGHLRQVIAIIPSRKLVILSMGLTREDIGYSVAKLLYAIVAASRSNKSCNYFRVCAIARRDICCGCTRAVGIWANRTSTKIYEYAP